MHTGQYLEKIMKASELIQRLEELIKKHGDVECLTYDAAFVSHDGLEPVEDICYFEGRNSIVIDCYN